MARTSVRSARASRKTSGRRKARSGGGMPWAPVLVVGAILAGGYLMMRKPAAAPPAVPAVDVPASSANSEAPQPSEAAPRSDRKPAPAPEPTPVQTPTPVPVSTSPAVESLRSTPVAALPGGTIGLAEAKAAFDSGSAIFVDARVTNGYVFGHVPGAVSLPGAQFDPAFAVKGPALSHDLRLIVYAADANAPEVEQTAAELGKRGFAKVVRMPEGWNAWAAAGYPKERGFGATP